MQVEDMKTASISYVDGKPLHSKDFSVHTLWVKTTETLFYSSQNNLKRKITLYIPIIKGKNDNIMRYNFSQISTFDREITYWDFKILYYICDMLHKAMSLLNGNYELPFYLY